LYVIQILKTFNQNKNIFKEKDDSTSMNVMIMENASEIFVTPNMFSKSKVVVLNINQG